MHEEERRRYILKFTEEEVKNGNLLREEKEHVLSYWLRINGLNEYKEKGNA